MAEHGTRTMYTYYGCRCEACCRAEHEQYLKRKEAQLRSRYNSKWGEHYERTDREERHRRYNVMRDMAIKVTHARRITWKDIADKYEWKCAVCGIKVDTSDTWTGKNGRVCFGRAYPTIDHIIPLKYGGKDTFDNVQLLCKHCNSAKGTKLYAF